VISIQFFFFLISLHHRNSITALCVWLVSRRQFVMCSRWLNLAFSYCKNISKLLTKNFSLSLFHLPRAITDDPYYCGMRARVPNFGKATINGNNNNNKIINSNNKMNNGSSKSSNNKSSSNRIVDNNSNYISSNNLSRLMKEKEHKKMSVVAPMSTFPQMHANGRDLYHHQQQQQPMPQPQHYSMWHAKSYESGIGEIHI
jgi:hypothetical protein